MGKGDGVGVGGQVLQNGTAGQLWPGLGTWVEVGKMR